MNQRKRKAELYRKLAAPARLSRKDQEALPPELHALCIRWGEWAATRNRYGAPGGLTSVLGNLRRRELRGPSEGPDAIVSCDLLRFHSAVVAHEDQQQLEAFVAYYSPERMRRQLLCKQLAYGFGWSSVELRRHVHAVARKSFARMCVGVSK